MIRRVGMAVAGAVLAAGMVGGASFAASGGSGGRNGNNGQSSTQTNTSTSSHNPADAAKAIHCADLQLQVVQAQLAVSSAKNAHQRKALIKKAIRLQQEWLAECATP